jgi:hypothetical protein
MREGVGGVTSNSHLSCFIHMNLCKPHLNESLDHPGAHGCLKSDILCMQGTALEMISASVVTVLNTLLVRMDSVGASTPQDETDALASVCDSYP